MAAVEIITPRDKDHWLSLRRQDVTSTESSCLFGLSPYMTQFELYHRKHSGIESEFSVNERMVWGNRLEAAIAAGVAEERGWQVEPFKAYWRLPAERVGSSFDYVIKNHPTGPAHMEVKNVDSLAFRNEWQEEDGEIYAPAHIELQVQHQMMVSGFGLSFICALVGGNRAVVLERARDEEVISALRSACSKFWRDVDAGNEPSPIMPKDADALIAMNQRTEPGRVLDASGDEEIQRLVSDYSLATSEIRRLEQDAKTLKALLLQAIGDAERVTMPRFKISASVVKDSQPKIITPEMVGQTTGGRKGYRRFEITEKN